MHIGTLMRLLAAEPRSIAGLLFHCQYLCGTILVTPCSMVGTGGFQEQGQCIFIGLAPRLLFFQSWEHSLMLTLLKSLVIPLLEYCCQLWNPLLLLLKKVGSARLRESDVHPISPKTPAHQYQPIDRKKRKRKRVEDYSRNRAA